MLQYKGRVTVEYDVDEDTLSCSIFKMTLQPVVENAFVHGVREKDAQCKIQISSRAMQDKFIIYVFDDGRDQTRGMSSKLTECLGRTRMTRAGAF